MNFVKSGKLKRLNEFSEKMNLSIINIKKVFYKEHVNSRITIY